jgi:hypothetical protein
MHRRATLACSAFLFAIGCSDGTEPLTGPSGVFGAQLAGVRSGMLSGSAEAQEIFIETGNAFVVRMIAESGNVGRFMLLQCPGETAPARGTYSVGPGADCLARYLVFTSTGPEPGSVITERAEADGGSVTIGVSNAEEVGGTFRFHGTLVEGSDTVGVVSASGSFRATVFP